MAFGSDNQAGVHPKIMAAIMAANEGICPSYGADDYTLKCENQIKQIFETEDLDFYIVTSGGAANGLALACLCPNYGAVLCHSHAHIIADEGTGPEMFMGGARLIGVGAGNEKLLPIHLERAALAYPTNFVHGAQIKAVSITNLNENGEFYSKEEITELAKICKNNDWGLHCDGARFANALVSQKNSTAAALSHQAGIDVLSFGLTKNGAMIAEAFIVFGKARNSAAQYMRKRSGQLISKHRFLSAQFLAMFENDLWLDLASHANQMALKLRDKLISQGYEIIGNIGGNEVFVRMTKTQAENLQNKGISFYEWGALGENAYRFVCSWATNEGDIAKI